MKLFSSCILIIFFLMFSLMTGSTFSLVLGFDEMWLKFVFSTSSFTYLFCFDIRIQL